jgi:hypothetical protein
VHLPPRLWVWLARPTPRRPGPSSVNQTASRLQASGHNVILNKVGNAPLDQCTVSAVRPGHTHSRTDHGVPGGALTTTVISKTVYIDVMC